MPLEKLNLNKIASLKWTKKRNFDDIYKPVSPHIKSICLNYEDCDITMDNNNDILNDEVDANIIHPPSPPPIKKYRVTNVENIKTDGCDIKLLEYNLKDIVRCMWNIRILGIDNNFIFNQELYFINSVLGLKITIFDYKKYMNGIIFAIDNIAKLKLIVTEQLLNEYNLQYYEFYDFFNITKEILIEGGVFRLFNIDAANNNITVTISDNRNHLVPLSTTGVPSGQINLVTAPTLRVPGQRTNGMAGSLSPLMNSVIPFTQAARNSLNIPENTPPIIIFMPPAATPPPLTLGPTALSGDNGNVNNNIVINAPGDNQSSVLPFIDEEKQEYIGQGIDYDSDNDVLLGMPAGMAPPLTLPSVTNVPPGASIVVLPPVPPFPGAPPPVLPTDTLPRVLPPPPPLERIPWGRSGPKVHRYKENQGDYVPNFGLYLNRSMFQRVPRRAPRLPAYGLRPRPYPPNNYANFLGLIFNQRSGDQGIRYDDMQKSFSYSGLRREIIDIRHINVSQIPPPPNDHAGYRIGIQAEIDNMNDLLQYVRQYLQRRGTLNTYYHRVILSTIDGSYSISTPLKTDFNECIKQLLELYLMIMIKYVDSMDDVGRSLFYPQIVSIESLSKDKASIIGRGTDLMKYIKEKSDKYKIYDIASKTNCLYIAVVIGLGFAKKKIVDINKTIIKKAYNLKKKICPDHHKYATDTEIKKIVDHKYITIKLYDDFFKKFATFKPTYKNKTRAHYIVRIRIADKHYSVLLNKQEYIEKYGSEQSVDPKPTYIRPVPVRKYNIITNPIATFDIECLRSETSGIIKSKPSLIGYEQIPYCIGYSFIVEEDMMTKVDWTKYEKIECEMNGGMKYTFGYRVIKGIGCIKEFLQEIFSNPMFDGYYFYGHNSGNYDNRIIIGHGDILSTESFVTIRNETFIEINGTIINMELFRKHRGAEISIIFRDSFRLLPIGLEGLTKEFKVPHPKLSGYSAKHDEFNINTWEELYIRYEIDKYLRNDVIGLLEVLCIFNDGVVKPQLNLSIQSCYTAASLSKKYYYSAHYRQGKYTRTFIYKLSQMEDEFIRESYCGGRVEVFFIGRISSPLYYFDFTSLYPFVAKKPLPCGKPKFIDKSLFYHRTSVYKCKYTTVFWEVWVKSPLAALGRPTNQKPLFAQKEHGRLLFQWYKDWTKLILYEPEIILAIELGLDYDFDAIRGLQFQCETFMDEAVDKVFENKKNETKKGNVGYAYVWKIILNSMYGIWGIKTHNRRGLEISDIKNSNYGIYLVQEKLYDMEVVGPYVVLSADKELDINDNNVAVASAITSYARMELYELMHSIINLTPDELEQAGYDRNLEPAIIYVDTDSCICNVDLKKIQSIQERFMPDFSGEQLGSLKNEIDAKIAKVKKSNPTYELNENYFAEGIFIAPKSYYLRTSDKQIIAVACKGHSGKPSWEEYNRCVDYNLPKESRYFTHIQNQFKGGNAAFIKGHVGVTIIPNEKRFCVQVTKGNFIELDGQTYGQVLPFIREDDNENDNDDNKEDDEDEDILNILEELKRTRDSMEIEDIDELISVHDEKDELDEKAEELIITPDEIDEKKQLECQLYSHYPILSSIKWYKKQWPCIPVELGYISVKYLYKQYYNNTDIHRYGVLKFDQFINVFHTYKDIQKPLFLYENLYSNVKLFCDIDLSLDETIAILPANVLRSAVNCIIEVAKDFGVILNQEDFYITSACNQTKISFHIVIANQIFKLINHQRYFWSIVEDKSKFYSSLYVNNQSVFDIKIYHKNRVMRTILSEKPQKNNPLKPIIIDSDDDIHYIDFDDIKFESYIINSNSIPNNYSQLSYDDETQSSTSPKKKNHGTNSLSSINRNTLINEDIRKQYEKQILEEMKDANDFDLNRMYLKNNYLTIPRKQPGFCSLCLRHHDRADRYALVNPGKVKINDILCFRK